MKPDRATPYAGFTLIELLTTIVVIGVLLAIAVPTYQDQVRKTRRNAAAIALTEMANLEEQFYADNFKYTAIMASLPYPTSSGGDGDYTLSIPSVTTSPPGFTVQAVAKSGQTQYQDTDCRTFTLTSSGIKGSKNSGGADSAGKGCWVTGD